jgi:hypothetical protein
VTEKSSTDKKIRELQLEIYDEDFTVLDSMRAAINIRRAAIRMGAWTPSSRMRVDHGPAEDRDEWTADHETAWQQKLTAPERELLADWRADLFRD